MSGDVDSSGQVAPMSKATAIGLVRTFGEGTVDGSGPRVAATTPSGDGELAHPVGTHPVGTAARAPVAESLNSLFLPPVAPVATRSVPANTAAFANPFSVPATKPTRRPAPAPTAQHVPRPTNNRMPPAPLVAQEEPDSDAVWERRGFEKDEQQLWLSGGLRAAEADLADRCRSAGIDPEELGRKLSGRTALQRLRDGEASTSVWARLREAEQQPRRTGTKLTGRFQLS